MLLHFSKKDLPRIQFLVINRGSCVLNALTLAQVLARQDPDIAPRCYYEALVDMDNKLQQDVHRLKLSAWLTRASKTSGNLAKLWHLGAKIARLTRELKALDG